MGAAEAKFAHVTAVTVRKNARIDKKLLLACDGGNRDYGNTITCGDSKIGVRGACSSILHDEGKKAA
jgi:hypothetical protein